MHNYTHTCNIHTYTYNNLLKNENNDTMKHVQWELYSKAANCVCLQLPLKK